MRATRLLIPLLLAAGPLAGQKVENYRKLEFMAGCWHAVVGKDQTAEEVWSSPTETIMLGRLEAPPGVEQSSVEVRFERAKCPGQK